MGVFGIFHTSSYLFVLVKHFSFLFFFLGFILRFSLAPFLYTSCILLGCPSGFFLFNISVLFIHQKKKKMNALFGAGKALTQKIVYGIFSCFFILYIVSVYLEALPFMVAMGWNSR